MPWFHIFASFLPSVHTIPWHKKPIRSNFTMEPIPHGAEAPWHRFRSNSLLIAHIAPKALIHQQGTRHTAGFSCSRSRSGWVGNDAAMSFCVHKWECNIQKNSVISHYAKCVLSPNKFSVVTWLRHQQHLYIICCRFCSLCAPRCALTTRCEIINCYKKRKAPSMRGSRG